MFTRPWSDPPDIPVSGALTAAVGGHPLVAAALARRGFSDPAAALAFLDPDRYAPAPASDLPGMDRAVVRLARAIRTKEPICVWGDFDVDGQTATALLASTLADLGASVTYHVPVRETEGHGISVPALKQVITDGARLILTCDTGIAAHAAIAYARTQRVDIIITDHHDLPETLPQATAIVNPKLLASSTKPAENGGAAARSISLPHPLYDLPGVGAAYKLAEALYTWARRPADVAQHLDLVALGIVADLALQRGDTRYLLQRGLAVLRRAERIGARVLLEAADINPGHLSEEHIGFVLGPRLNAAGRLADAGPCVELLTTSDVTRARIIAADLEALNARRKLLCDQVEAGAEAQIVANRALLDDAVLVLASPHWPAGVVGIVASRLVERYGRPAILIAAPPGGPGRASARSIEGVNITAAIAAHADLLLGFGGHPMAAGFSIDPEQIPEFRRGLSRTVAGLGGRGEPEALRIEGRLPLGELSLAVVDDLARLAPFGPGNPPLVLAAERVRTLTDRPVGRDAAHRLLIVADEEGGQHQVIWWNRGSQEPPEGTFDLAYVARASSYRGMREVQVELVALRPSAGAPVESGTGFTSAGVEVLDYRRAEGSRGILDKLLAGGDVVVWREGEAAAALAGHNRRTLSRGGTLAIWTIPPGPAELRAALAQVAPARVCLFSQDPGADEPAVFLRRLAGLIKHVLAAREGRVALEELAAATAQRRVTVEAALAWLVARGHIRVTAQAEDQVRLAPGAGMPPSPAGQQAAEARLSAALAETAAYRAFYRQAEAAALIPGAQAPLIR